MSNRELLEAFEAELGAHARAHGLVGFRLQNIEGLLEHAAERGIGLAEMIDLVRPGIIAQVIQSAKRPSEEIVIRSVFTVVS